MNNFATLYEELARHPTPDTATIAGDGEAGFMTVHSEWKQRDVQIPDTETIKFSRTQVLQMVPELGPQVVVESGLHEIDNEVWNRASPSGRYRAVLRKLRPSKGSTDDQQFIEIWSENCKLQTINLQSLDKHGPVYGNDKHFGSFEWSHGETHLLYMAEKKRPKFASYFDQKYTQKTEDDDRESNGNTVFGEASIYRQSWGETFTSVSDPVICVLDIESCVISILDNVPDNVSPAQAIWTPDDSGIVFVGWLNDPWKLGIVACTIRRSTLYHIDLQSASCSVIGKSDQSVRTPRFSPDMKHLAFMENEAGGPHHRSMRLRCCDWATKKISTVIDTVQKASADEFPGIYPSYLGLPADCWSSDNRRIVFHSVWRSRKELLCVDRREKKIKRLSTNEFGSWTLLTIKNDFMVVCCSSPNMPHVMRLARLMPSGGEKNINWVNLDPVKTLEDVRWKIRRFPVAENAKHPDYPELDVETVLLLPKLEGEEEEEEKESEAETVEVKPCEEEAKSEETEGGEITTNEKECAEEKETPKEEEKPVSAVHSSDRRKPPLIVYPHGGPHGTCVAEWNLFAAGFAKLGYAVALINYRGSAGFGDNSIFSLLGKVGSNDVSDVYHCTKSLINERRVDGDKLACFGGSHGGFLVAHLIGQFPDMFKAAQCRNPATDLTTQLGGSDIPDWAYEEAGVGPFSFTRIPSKEDLAEMIAKSPITVANKVKTPLMIVLGASDKRVPPEQGLQLYRVLKANGAPVRLYIYENNGHALSKADCDSEVFVNTCRWYAEHLGAPVQQ